jgi:PAS domain S-box-containing protein
MDNQHFRSFYEISGEAIMLMSERHFMECNPACLNLFKASSLEGWQCLHLADILPEKQSDGIFSREALEQHMAEAIKHGSIRFECTFQKLDGMEFLADVQLSAVTDCDETILQVVLHDLGQRLLAERALRTAKEESIRREEELRLILRHLSVPVGVYHVSGGVDFLNDEFVRVLGYTQDDIPDIKSWWSVAYPDYDTRKAAQDRWGERLKIGQKASGTIPPYQSLITIKDGRKRLLRAWGRMFEDRIIVVFSDITEENRIAEATKTANQAKIEFLSRMSHELRTPLNSIIGFSKLLAMSGLSGRDEQNANRIHIAGKHLLALVDEIMDISLIESRELDLTFESINVNELLSAVVDIVKPMAAQREIGIIHTKLKVPLPIVYSDESRLQQVMLNLLSNAIKYNRDQGLVNLSVHSIEGRIRIEIRDTGLGIPKKKMNRLFIPFDRLGVQNKMGNIKGTGLGLSITKRLVNALGGEIIARSKVGEGSVFVVELPSSNEPLAPSQRTIAIESGEQLYTSTLTILYIEDDAGSMALVEQVVGNRPTVNLLTASKAKQGIDLAREHQPDLIFLDFNLPDFNGDEVLIRLKMDPLTRKIPVYILSADAMDGQIERLKGLGAVGYITKPLDIDYFLEVLDGNQKHENNALDKA